MKNNQKWYLMAGVGLSILYYLWMTTGWWKLGATVVNTVFLAVLVKFFGKKVKGDKFWWFLWGSSMVLGIFLSVRSSEITTVFNAAAIIVANLILGVLAKKKSAILSFERMARVFLGFFGNWLKELVNTGRMIGSLSPKKIGSWGKLVAGVLMSIPLLVVFGGLFYSADPIFAKLVNNIYLPNWDLREIINFRTISTVFFFGAVLAVWQSRMVKRNKNFRVWKFITETNIAVAILEVLFLVFSFIQIRYFFATTEMLKELNIVFSEYTRRGYNEMIVASLLAWGVVFGLDYSIRSQKKLGVEQIKTTKWLSLAIVGEILLFIISATRRNWIYQNAYGFTQLRLLGFWLSLWLVAILTVTVIKIVKSKTSNYLVRRMGVVTLVALIGLNVFNIDRTIAVMRPAKLAQGVDYRYIVGLSNDGWEGLEEVLSDIERRINNNEISSTDEAMRLQTIVDMIQDKQFRLQKQSDKNWQTMGAWNLSDTKAYKFLSVNSYRIKVAEENLSALVNKMASADEKKLNETANLYRGEIRKVLLKHENININDLVGWKPFFGYQEFMKVDVSTSVKQAIIDDIKTQIQNVTDRKCNMLEYQWATEKVRYNSYKVMCNL